MARNFYSKFYPEEVYQIQQLLYENPNLTVAVSSNEPIGFCNREISRKTIHYYFKDILKEYTESEVGLVMTDSFVFKYESFDTNIIIFQCDDKKALIKYLKKYKIPYQIIGDYQHISIRYVNNYVAKKRFATPIKYYVKDKEENPDFESIKNDEDLEVYKSLEKLQEVLLNDSLVTLYPKAIVQNSIIRHYNYSNGGGLLEININTKYQIIKKLCNHYEVKFIYDGNILYYVSKKYNKFKIAAKEGNYNLHNFSKLIFEDYGFYIKEFQSRELDIVEMLKRYSNIKIDKPFIVLKRINQLKG